MKKLILCLVLILFAMPAASAEEWLSIGELRQQTPERWTQTWETKWRTISIDAPVVIPDVAQAPVMLVEGAMETPVLTAQETGWDKISVPDHYRLSWSNPWPDYPSKANGKKLNSQQESWDNWYSGIESEGRYVPMSETTFDAICDLVDSTLIQFGCDPQDYTYRMPFHMWAQHMFYYGKKQDALPGTVFFEFYSKLGGIPVFSHIQRAVVDHKHGESREDEYTAFPEGCVIYHGYGEYLGSIRLWKAAPTEVLAQDVPLCSFDQIQAVIEAEIEDGHIRKIYEVELGYVLFNLPGEYRQEDKQRSTSTSGEAEDLRFYAKPMWRVNCLWVDRATGKLRSTPSDSDDERNTLDYYQLLIDAQTGELVGESSAQDRCEFKGFIP